MAVIITSTAAGHIKDCQSDREEENQRLAWENSKSTVLIFSVFMSIMSSAMQVGYHGFRLRLNAIFRLKILLVITDQLSTP